MWDWKEGHKWHFKHQKLRARTIGTRVTYFLSQTLRGNVILVNGLTRQKCGTRGLVLCQPGSMDKTSRRRRLLRSGEPCCDTCSGQKIGPRPMQFCSTGIAKDFRPVSTWNHGSLFLLWCLSFLFVVPCSLQLILGYTARLERKDHVLSCNTGQNLWAPTYFWPLHSLSLSHNSSCLLVS